MSTQPQPADYRRDLRRGPTIVGPVVLITIGGLFLYKQWHPAFSPWEFIRLYWPVLLIIIGVSKIIEAGANRRYDTATSGWGAAVAVIVVILIFVGIFGRHGRFFRDRHRDSDRIAD